MTIREKVIKIIDIILDERLMYQDDEVLSLPIDRFKSEGIFADEFSKIMEKLTYEGCLISEEDFDICNFDPTYIYYMNYAMVKPNYKKLEEYRRHLEKNNTKLEITDFTTGKNKIYIDKKYFTDIKRIKSNIILIYFAERYAKSIISISIDDFLNWCKIRYPELYLSAKKNSQGINKWFRNGIDQINEKFLKKHGKNNLIITNKETNKFDITKPIEIK